MTGERKVFKYTFRVGEPEVFLPADAQILAVGVQNCCFETLTLWAMVDPNQRADVLRKLHVAGTGHPLPETVLGRFLGSVQAGPFVWHVWDEPGHS